ncbi:hypothetical protein [Pedobacter alpinus]|uniref:Uncharacterized protein n=1 Tax=Pedobacter alpinus TaxID=1590643 RepID=A0ABW5TNH7_9SPHI
MKKKLLSVILICFITMSFAQTNTFPISGNVGIGTLNPLTKLDISGDLSISSASIPMGLNTEIGGFTPLLNMNINFRGPNVNQNYVGASFRIDTRGEVVGAPLFQWIKRDINTNTEEIKMVFTKSGHLGIGTTSPHQILDINGGIGFSNQNSQDKTLYSPVDGVLEWMTNNAADQHGFAISHQGERIFYFNTDGQSYFNGGNVGIGTTTPDEKLTVKGKLHAEEVRVDLSVPGPDYVFEKDYPLLSLAETRKYILENKHLPEVPSAKEMEQNGINLSEMNMLLLKKVEELTLHLINQNKTLEELKVSNQYLTEQVHFIKNK